MLLIVHIIVAVASVGAAIGLFANAKKPSRAKALMEGTIVGTLATVLSGVGLMFQGGSVVRICAEAFALIVLSGSAVWYSQKQLNLGEGTHETN